MSSSSDTPNISLSQFQDLIDAALKEYSRKTGKDIATDPLTAKLLRCGSSVGSSNAILGVLQEQAHAFNQFRNGDWKVQLMRRLKPTVDILLRLSTSGVFGQGIGLNFPPAQAIFAGVGLLLAAAKGVSTSYDALIDLFECFEHYLSRLKVLSTIPSAVGEILVKIMVELLGVLALATQQIKEGRFKKFAKKLLGENDIEAVLQRLDRLTMEESRITVTQTMEVVYGLFNNMKVVMDDGKASIDNFREALVTMQKISDDLNKIKYDQLHERIQKWLSPPDPSINHNTACETHHNGTAAWFLEGRIYNEWKATGALLWTHGNPGSGKSVLCSSIIKDIESLRATGLASAVYYYFDFKDTGKQDRRGLLSSLLTQLCTRPHHGYDMLSKLYKAHQNGSRQPSEADLIQCLKDVLAFPGHGRVYIVVDAVDESPNKPGIPSPREKVLQLMKELVDLCHSDLRVCITSRPEVDIRTVLEPLASHAVSLHDERGQMSDINNYIESVVESDANMRKWRPEDRRLVIDSLSRKASGMFRWVICQLDTLRRCFPASIRHALNELPMTLDETYERILLGIDREKRDHAIRLLKCLAFSRRPLRVKELAEILAVRFDTTIPRLDTSLRPGDADEAVLSACSTLVTTIELDDHDPDDDDDDDYYNSRIVQFSHYSVKEFLTSGRLAESDKRDLSQYYISPEPAHTILAQSCISTLLQPDIRIEDITDNFPLAKYAAQNWFHHARCDGVACQIRDGMEHLFDPDKNHFSMWISIHDIDDPGSLESSEASPLYYAALCGVRSLVEHLIIMRRQNPNKSYGAHGTPLQAAVLSGHTTVVQLLLDHTANANGRDMDTDPPLCVAARSGNLDIARLLLSHGADINSLNFHRNPPLHEVVRSHKHDIVELLVKSGANVNVRNMKNWTPLHEAVDSGNADIVRLLLSHGADGNTVDYRGDSPLHRAVRSLKHDVVSVELLVKSGVDVNVRSMNNWTPLHEAVDSGDVDIVRLLLSHGADGNTVDYRGDSPLHHAVRSLKHDVVELLVKSGVDVNVRNFYNQTPAHEAADNGNLEMVRLLLGHGTDTSTIDPKGDSLLHKAVRSQKLDFVQLLLKGVADVNLRNLYNQTPVHEAADNGNLEMVRLLLGHGTDTNTLDLKGDSLLHQAVRSQKLDIVELVLKGVADVNVRNFYNWTPLHEAANIGNLEMVQLLLGHGADTNTPDPEGESLLHKAVRSQRHDFVELVLKSVADVNVRNFCNRTPLHEAANNGNLDIVLLLLSNCADVNALDHWRVSPLHEALRTRKSGVVELLVKGGADVNVRNIYDATPLHEAVESGNFDVMKTLLSHGADLNARGFRHKTPLHLASLGGSLDISRLLIEHGADIDAQDGEGQTPFSIALANGHRKLARFLSNDHVAEHDV